MAYQGEPELRDAIEATYTAISALADPEATSTLSSCLDKMTTVQAKLAQTGGGQPAAAQQAGPPPGGGFTDPREALMAQLGGGGAY